MLARHPQETRAETDRFARRTLHLAAGGRTALLLARCCVTLSPAALVIPFDPAFLRPTT